MFHAFIGEIYRSFYANLGATMADVGHDPMPFR
jgi:hypothetical protein